MFITPRVATVNLLPPGVYVRLDAVGVTADSVDEGDEVKTESDVYYQVETVKEHFLGDSFFFRECDLTLSPFKNLNGGTYSASSVEDARYRTKVYLETYLDDDALPDYIIAYGKPDYPMTRVFKDKNVDLVFALGKPESEPVLDFDRYPIGYEEFVPIGIYCVDKDNIDGEKLVWQAETELRRVTETYSLGSLRQLTRVRDTTQRLGSTILYGVEYLLRYKRGVS